MEILLQGNRLVEKKGACIDWVHTIIVELFDDLLVNNYTTLTLCNNCPKEF